MYAETEISTVSATSACVIAFSASIPDCSIPRFSKSSRRVSLAARLATASSLFAPEGAIAFMTAARTTSTFCPTTRSIPRDRAASVKPRAITSVKNPPSFAVVARPEVAEAADLLAPPFAETYLRPAVRNWRAPPPPLATQVIARRARVQGPRVPSLAVVIGSDTAEASNWVRLPDPPSPGDSPVKPGGSVAAVAGASDGGDAPAPTADAPCAQLGRRCVLSRGPELLADVPISTCPRYRAEGAVRRTGE